MGKKNAPGGAHNENVFRNKNIPKFDIREVAAAALSSAEAVASRWAPGGKRQGAEWVALNPTRADDSPGSFSINLSTGAWGDFARADKGGDLVSLVAYIEGCNQGEAARQLGEFLGLRPGPAPSPSRGLRRRPKLGPSPRPRRR
jgi:putative DNA primase/helicase